MVAILSGPQCVNHIFTTYCQSLQLIRIFFMVKDIFINVICLKKTWLCICNFLYCSSTLKVLRISQIYFLKTKHKKLFILQIWYHEQYIPRITLMVHALLWFGIVQFYLIFQDYIGWEIWLKYITLTILGQFIQGTQGAICDHSTSGGFGRLVTFDLA